MKKIFVFMILFCISLNAQNDEFKVYNNGLIYSENSVAKLKHIVDSLNLKFKVCEFNKIFLSCSQTKANYVSIEKVKVLEAKKDLENNISYLEFKAKYPKANFDENLVVVKSLYTNYENSERVEFSSLELGKSQSQRIISTQKNNDSYKHNFKGKWIFEFQEKTKYSAASLNAFYFIEDFKTKPIASKYARLIQYSDCMVDTTAQVFFDGAKESGVRYYDTLPNQVKKLEQYVNNALKKPTFDYRKFSDEFEFEGKIKKKSKKK